MPKSFKNINQNRPKQDNISSSPSDEATSTDTYEQELHWCIQQLELSLNSKSGTTQKQEEVIASSLKTLRSTKAPLIKKRQVMHQMCGDYRKKMEGELKQHTLDPKNMKIWKVTGKSKSVFIKRSGSNSERRSESEDSVLRLNGGFCFNFPTPN